MSSVEKIRVPLEERSYDILVAPGLLQTESAVHALRKVIEDRKVLLVADSNTGKLYGQQILDLLEESGAVSAAMHIFPAGETSKTFTTVEGICRAAFQAQLDRKSVIVALGGGVCGDLAGFAAAIYMRGIDCVQVPTSLLAMIDSSVGGKTGADLPDGKNLIGAFHQPKLVLMDMDVLKTLPADQIRSGAAELLKHAILFDPDLFRTLRDNAQVLLHLSDPEMVARFIARSCSLKASVVAGDEKESAGRALLNLGHSFGHAVEKLLHFEGMSHGEAVAFGTAVAARLANRLDLLSSGDAEGITDLLKCYALPVRIKGFTPAQILEAMQGDKKNLGGKKRLILPLKIGKCDIFSDVDERDILLAIGDCCD